jgi:hypothetical protein
MRRRYALPVHSGLLILIALFATGAINAQPVIDSFSDGDFTNNPAWGGDVAQYSVVTSSDVAAGATNSNTLRLTANNNTSPAYLSLQNPKPWGTSQSWGFWIGRRGQTATAANFTRVFLYANESTLENTTVDGYAVEFGDDLVGGDQIRLVRITNGVVASTVITSSGAVTNGLTDIGFLVRVTRTATGSWALFTSTLPTTNGSGATANSQPTLVNTAVSQGTGSDNTYSTFTGGYVGIYGVFQNGSTATVGFEFDNFFFDPNSESALPVELTSYWARTSGHGVTLNWTTASESENAGFEIFRSTKGNGEFQKIASYVSNGELAGLGTSSSGRNYSYFDNGFDLRPGTSYLYQLVSVDKDGMRHEYDAKEVRIEDAALNTIPVTVFPNPVVNTMQLRYATPGSDLVRIALYTSLGEQVAGFGNDGPYTAGSGEITLSTAGLPNGVYVLQVSSGVQTTTEQIVIQR